VAPRDTLERNRTKKNYPTPGACRQRCGAAVGAREPWRRFGLALPRILGALACTGCRFCALGSDLRDGPLLFGRPYEANRDADPVAACVREIMVECDSWMGTQTFCGPAPISAVTARDRTGWPKNPGALAGRLRRAQTFLRMLGIEISFTREGRAGTRTIRISAGVENRATIVSAVSSVSVLCHDISIGCGKPPKNWGVLQARERC